MYIVVYFTNNGVPRTGLSPIINGYDVSDNSLDLNAQTMSEIGNGGYKYNFSDADDTKMYYFMIDGGAALPDTERYAYGCWGMDIVASRHDTTDGKIDNMQTDLTIVKKIETGRWRIVNNQMIFYDDDGATPLYTFDLKDSDGDPTSLYPAERVPK